MTEPPLKIVAVFNASDDTVEMLKALLTLRVYRAVDGKVDDVKSGRVDFVAFRPWPSSDGRVNKTVPLVRWPLAAMASTLHLLAYVCAAAAELPEVPAPHGLPRNARDGGPRVRLRRPR